MIPLSSAHDISTATGSVNIAVNTLATEGFKVKLLLQDTSGNGIDASSSTVAPTFHSGIRATGADGKPILIPLPVAPTISCDRSVPGYLTVIMDALAAPIPVSPFAVSVMLTDSGPGVTHLAAQVSVNPQQIV